MFGLTFEKLLLVGVIAAFILGPERLPHYAGMLARFVRNVRDYANNAKSRMKEEMGPEFDDVDWRKLDPRQYDPRRIIREALLEGPDSPQPKSPGGPRVQAPRAAGAIASTPTSALEPMSSRAAESPSETETPAPGTALRFDNEAT